MQKTGKPVPSPKAAKPDPLSFAARLVAWQKQYGRHDLPWQHPRSDYRVWLSEVMLQQTQVATVIPYFERFLKAFPNLSALACASSESVMAQWSGLGYYRRARMLHACAQTVQEQYGGVFPVARDALVALPGIGRTTAAAIRVFAHGERDAILDGNVKRVLCRHYAIDGVPDAGPTQRVLWPLAERELPERDVLAYTQGLMDLGATVCTRSRPDCQRCPVASTCVALAENRIHELPTRRVRAALPRRQQTVLIVRDDNSNVLLVSRPEFGIWGGLMSLPETELLPTAQPGELLAGSGLQFLVPAESVSRPYASHVLAPIDHVFTHFHLQIRPVLIDIGASSLPPYAADSAGAALRFMALTDTSSAALPAPIKALLTAL